MKNILKLIIICQIIAFSNIANACSFLPGYNVGEPFSDVKIPKGVIPKPPVISKFTITRGYDDGNGGSCSDAGILRIVLGKSEGVYIQSYEIRVASGSLPEHLIPEFFITPIRFASGEQGFDFYWLDMPQGSTELKVIDAVLEIRQLTYGGRLSEPSYVRVINLGTSG